MDRRAFLQRGSRAALALCLPAATQTPRAWRRALPELEKHIAQSMRELAVPGVSVALIKDAILAWQRGFGVRDAESNAPVDRETIFSAGSMSKPVFAYAVMQLCDKKILDLDTPLTKYSPVRYLAGDPRLDLVTARHVLSHTTGFPNWRSATEPLRIQFTPGEKFSYSGEGYSYLQSAVTYLRGHVNPKACAKYEDGLEVCATDIEQYMKAQVFAPFGMSSSGYVWNRRIDGRLARPHGAKGEPLAKIRPSATDASRYAAAGALLTTAADYARFMLEVINPRETGPFRLRKRTVAEMLRPHVKTNDEFGSSWALGWQVQQSGVINHGGDNTGFHSHAVASVEGKSGFVIMTNGERGAELIVKLLMSELMQQLL